METVKCPVCGEEMRFDKDKDLYCVSPEGPCMRLYRRRKETDGQLVSRAMRMRELKEKREGVVLIIETILKARRTRCGGYQPQMLGAETWTINIKLTGSQLAILEEAFRK